MNARVSTGAHITLSHDPIGQIVIVLL